MRRELDDMEEENYEFMNENALSSNNSKIEKAYL